MQTEERAHRHIVFGCFMFFVAVAVVVVTAAQAQIDIPLRQGHYETQKRYYQAQQAHSIFRDPQSQCQWYDCDSSDAHLRVCLGDVAGNVVHAVQWLFETPDGTLHEGTSFIQRDSGKLQRYLRNNGCKEAR